MKRDKTSLFFEVALVPVHFNEFSCSIINVDHSTMGRGCSVSRIRLCSRRLATYSYRERPNGSASEIRSTPRRSFARSDLVNLCRTRRFPHSGSLKRKGGEIREQFHL